MTHLIAMIGVTEATRCARNFGDLDALFFNDLTNAEGLAFYVYATAQGWHSRINYELWSGSPSAEVSGFASMLNRGLAKLPAMRNRPVYRGYRANNLTQFQANYVAGSQVTFPGFTSASFDEFGAFGGNVLFIIRAQSAKAIWHLSPNYIEQEALLPTGCSFDILSVALSKSKLVIILEEV